MDVCVVSSTLLLHLPLADCCEHGSARDADISLPLLAGFRGADKRRSALKFLPPPSDIQARPSVTMTIDPMKSGKNAFQR